MIRPFALSLAVAALALPAQAHHSRAMFNTQRPMTLTGTVREFQFTNPHCYIQLAVPGSGGAVEWSIEMGAPSHLRGRGWKRSTLQPGDQVRVTIAPLRDGKPGGELVSITTAEGQPLRGLS